MTPKPRTKRFLGRELTRDGDSWHSQTREGYPFITIAKEDTSRTIIVWMGDARCEVKEKTERAARNAMVRKLRRLRDELSKLEF